MTEDYWSAEYKAALVEDLNDALDGAAAHRQRANALAQRVQVLEAQAEALATALQAIYDGINDEWHPAFREDLLTDQDRTLLVRARAALTGWQEAEK